MFVRWLALPVVVVLGSGCANVSSEETGGLETSEAAVTQSAELRGYASPELRSDLRAALGLPESHEGEVLVPGVLRITDHDFWGNFTLSSKTWSYTPTSNGGGDLSFPNVVGSVDRDIVGGPSAKTLYEAMVGADERDEPLIVGWRISRRSPGGLVECSYADSFHLGESHHSCSIRGVLSLGQSADSPR